MIVLAVLACRPEPARRPSEPGSEPVPEPSSSSSPTVPPDPESHLPRVALPPSARVLGIGGSSGLDLARGALIVPAHAGDDGVLLLGGYGGSDPYVDLPATFVVPGAVPPGDHLVMDVAVGGFADVGLYSNQNGSTAGDADGDGHHDVWLNERLFHGPFDRTLTLADTAAAVSDPNLNVPLGGVDADLDGIDDLIVTDGRRLGYVFYGPFSGSIPAPGDPAHDPSQVTEFAAGASAVAALPDHRGPGTMAFVTGWGGYDYEFSYIYDLPLDPGTTYYTTAPVATYGGGADWTYFMAVRGLGDVNGDGFGDALFGEMHDFTQVAFGPFDGNLSGWYDHPEHFLELVSGSADHSVGDLSGDGVTDLLATCDDWQMLLLSPFEPPVDPCLGFPIHPNGIQDPFGTLAGDLDGDGLSDFVQRVRDEEPRGVAIWYAADVLAAITAR